MCVEKTPWELVIDFHGHTCPGIALGYRIAQIALREMGIRPTPDSECLVKAYTQSCAVDAFQVLNHATIGRRSLILDEMKKHVYEFHFTGTEEILQFTISPIVLDYLTSLRSGNLSPRERQNKNLEGIQYILSLDESSFCTMERTQGQLYKV
jgi:formylmethanofuran dehydrogenase subunit E